MVHSSEPQLWIALQRSACHEIYTVKLWKQEGPGPNLRLTIIEENTGNTTVQRNERKRGGMEVSEK
jgi:hypothetical protein